MYVSVLLACMPVCYVGWCLQRAKDSAGSPKAGVTTGVSRHVGAGD